MEGAKRRGEEPEVGAGRRAKQEALRAVESLWEPCEARCAERGGRRTAEASRSGAQGQQLRRDRVRERDLEVLSRITRAGAQS